MILEIFGKSSIFIQGFPWCVTLAMEICLHGESWDDDSTRHEATLCGEKSLITVKTYLERNVIFDPLLR